MNDQEQLLSQIVECINDYYDRSVMMVYNDEYTGEPELMPTFSFIDSNERLRGYDDMLLDTIKTEQGTMSIEDFRAKCERYKQLKAFL